MRREHPSDTTLLAYRAGELPAAIRKRVDAHVPHCPQCQRELAALATVGRLLREGSPPDAPPESLARLQARLARETLPWGRRSGWWRSVPIGSGRLTPRPRLLQIQLIAVALALTVVRLRRPRVQILVGSALLAIGVLGLRWRARREPGNARRSAAGTRG